MAVVKFKDINKIYDNKVQAVFDFNLEVQDKEFVVLVGPSGCGKSTTLRMVAGLEEITSGEISIDGEIINEVHPKDRNIAMVFQSYALYPHMTVYNNMAFALKMHHVPKEEIDKKVRDAAEILGLTDYLKRKPKALSGGQRQRVALGRAIVRTPKVFLMDEPLSNLDAKLRVAMRSEITRIHKTVGATTIYVTHDQTEAMTMADRIVIMKDGYVQQVGKPKDVYNKPNNVFVASFIGSPAMNLFDAKMICKDEQIKIIFENAEIDLPKDMAKSMPKEFYDGEEHTIYLGIRPEDIYLSDQCHVEHSSKPIQMVTNICELLGSELFVYCNFNNKNLIFKTRADTEIDINQKISVCFNLAKIHLFDKDSTQRIN